MKIHKTDSLKPLAKKLRTHFEQVQSDRHHPARFQWDWWHLPGRYTHLRTPASLYFQPPLHEDLVKAVSQYARVEFGCRDISPIWLSNYVEGCEQRLHADRPHGPWAFVLSLTPDFRSFQGGETILIRDQVLRFWESQPTEGQAFEESEILTKLPSHFGRMIVFDPRIPHGVSRVSGTVDPMQGRLVLHGWFTNPQPFVEGSLTPKKVEPILKRLDDKIAQLDAISDSGTVAYCIAIRANGAVASVKRLKSSLENSKSLDKLVRSFFTQTVFPKGRGPSKLTLPLTIN